jgi:regulatory protein
MKKTASQSPGVQDPLLHYACRLLSYRSRSEREMRERLSMKGFCEDEINRAITHLRSVGLLDDGKLAHSLIRYAGEAKGLGLSGTKRFLLERGVPREIIDETTREIDEVEIAMRLLYKKVRAWSKSSRPDQARLKKRLYGFFSRRGYTSETIRKAMEEYTAEEDNS